MTDAEERAAKRAEEREKWIESHDKKWNVLGRGVGSRAITVQVKGRIAEIVDLQMCIEAAGLPCLQQNIGPVTYDFTVMVPYDGTESSAAYIVKMARTRMAGAHRKRPMRGNSPEIDYDTTCDEFLVWRESHTAAECAAALGLSRSTYFRRLKDIQARADAGEGDHRVFNV